MKEETNRTINEDLKNTSLRTNKESPLLRFKTPEDDDSISSEIISPITVHLEVTKFSKILHAKGAKTTIMIMRRTARSKESMELPSQRILILNLTIKIMNKKIMKLPKPRETVQEISCNEDQEKLHCHEEDQACHKKIRGKMNDLYEQNYMNIESKYKCTQDMGHTSMSPYGILDKVFTEIIN